MAHRLLGRGLSKPPIKVKQICQQFKYLLILDFEATCEKNILLKPPEIIEFPCLALSTEDWQVKDIFHEYVKPRVNPILTPFCTELTGIMQETVEDQPHFPTIFEKFNKWLADRDFIREKNTSAFVTCGDWDLKVMLPNQCSLDDISLPKYFEKWINLKQTYCDVTDHYPRSLTDMLVRSDIPVYGKLHSGICDVQNMCKIITKLSQQEDILFKITSSADLIIKDSVI